MVRKLKEKTKDNFKKNAKDIFEYIQQNSLQNADNFKKELAIQLIEIRKNPKGFPPEF